MTDRIYTFGYEGLTLGGFIGRLKCVGIETVVDVRANPLSRKRGFSKGALSTALAEARIEYVHVPEMGCPKTVRERYKRDGNWSWYTRGFLAHLKHNNDALSALADRVVASTSCLICFEADFTRCHRTFVARGISEISGLTVTHLTDRTERPDAGARSAA